MQSPHFLPRPFKNPSPKPLFRLGIVIALASHGVWAQGAPSECIRTHANAQELESAGKLSEALKEFESCATEKCPKVIQKDCKVLGKAVAEALPTLELTVLDSTGQAPTDYGIELDGVAVPAQAAQLPLPVNPGEHSLTVRAPNRPATKVTVTARRNEKRRRIVLQLAVAEPVRASSSHHTSYVLAGLGAVGLVSFVGFASSGYEDEKELQSSDRSRFEPADLRLADQMRRKYLIADLSLSVSLVSLGVATYLWLTTPSSEKTTVSPKNTTLSLSGTASGGSVFVQHAF